VTRRILPRLSTALLLLAGLPSTGTAQIVGPQPGVGCAPRRPQLAVGQALGVNLFVNRFDIWVLDEETQHVNFESWARNLRLGWEWDENGFSTNMFSHPFHGAQYFNAGRANCLSFWESIPLAFLGSWTWEYFGETNRPSLNDFFMTSIGGIALGEMTHRLAETIRDEEATGARRITREVLAMLVNPLAGVNRLWRGDWGRVRPNPPGYSPDVFDGTFKFAGRWVGQDTVGVCAFCPTLVLDVTYGDPLAQSFDKPFDVFEVRAQVSPDGGGLNVLEAAGRLYQVDLNASDSRRRHALAVTQRYAYSSYTPVFSYGAQSIELGILSRFPLPRDWQLHTRAAGNLLVMGAVDATNAGTGERDYDFGPGLGFGLEVDLWKHGHRYASLRNRAEYLYTVSGVPAEHLITFSRFETELPLTDRMGVGFATDINTRTSSYDAGDADTREFADVRFFLSWAIGR
jgi:hypothetical protein